MSDRLEEIRNRTNASFPDWDAQSYIYHYTNDILFLLSHIEKQRQEIERLRDAVRQRDEQLDRMV